MKGKKKGLKRRLKELENRMTATELRLDDAGIPKAGMSLTIGEAQVRDEAPMGLTIDTSSLDIPTD